MQAVILAGGRGTRLRPLTEKIPKPMVPINGKPFLFYQLNDLKKSGIKQITLCIGYLGNQIKNYFKDGRKIGLKIEYSAEDHFLGTAGAVKNAQPLIRDDFLLLFGDTYLPINHQQLITYFKHRYPRHLATMVVYSNKKKIAPSNVALDKDNFVTHYFKDGGLPHLTHLDGGIYVYKREVLDFIPDPKRVKSQLEYTLFPTLIENQLMTGYPIDQRFYDIGTHERLKIFNSHLKK